MKGRYIALTVVYCAGLFWLSSGPPPVDVEAPFSGADKVVHMVLFGGLAAVVSVGIRWSGGCPRALVQYAVPVVFAALYGLSDEIHQLFVPGRDFDPLDIVADAAGAVLVQLALYGLWRRTAASESASTVPATDRSSP
ncbi:MAG: VanZ family protein [bacterium]|nr:VanZ family protein [bacterium]